MPHPWRCFKATLDGAMLPLFSLMSKGLNICSHWWLTFFDNCHPGGKLCAIVSILFSFMFFVGGCQFTVFFSASADFTDVRPESTFSSIYLNLGSPKWKACGLAPVAMSVAVSSLMYSYTSL